MAFFATTSNWTVQGAHSQGEFFGRHLASVRGIVREKPRSAFDFDVERLLNLPRKGCSWPKAPGGEVVLATLNGHLAPNPNWSLQTWHGWIEDAEDRRGFCGCK